VRLLSLGQLYRRLLDSLIRDQTEKVRYAVNPRAPLVIGVDYVPRREWSIRGK